MLFMYQKKEKYKAAYIREYVRVPYPSLKPKILCPSELFSIMTIGACI
jgi:hypothetical protein